jgi:hypothetical protein
MKCCTACERAFVIGVRPTTVATLVGRRTGSVQLLGPPQRHLIWDKWHLAPHRGLCWMTGLESHQHDDLGEAGPCSR